MAGEVPYVVFDAGTTKLASRGVVINWDRVVEGGASYVPHYLLGDLPDRIRDACVGVPNVLFVGFAHSLAGEYVNGQSRYGYVGDPPNLKPIRVPDGVRERINGEEMAANSALMKLLGLGERPELVERIWGKGATYNKLRFTGFMSLLAEIGASEQLPTFPDEWSDFRMLVGEQGLAYGILGLDTQQMVLGKEHTVELGGGRSVTVMKDMRVDAWLLMKLYRAGVLKAGSMVWITDSVTKNGWDQPLEGATTLEDFNFLKMFMGGNTGRNWVLPLTREHLEIDAIGPMFKKYKETLHQSDIPRTWFFDPRANEEQGGLWMKPGARWVEVPSTELVQAVAKEQVLEVIRAIGWGVSAGMYADAPDGLEEIVLMGGLIGLHGEPQVGWRDLMVRAAPRGKRVMWLPISDSSVSGTYWMRDYLGEKIDYAREIQLCPLGIGEGGVEQWRGMRADVRAKSSI